MCLIGILVLGNAPGQGAEAAEFGAWLDLKPNADPVTYSTFTLTRESLVKVTMQSKLYSNGGWLLWGDTRWGDLRAEGSETSPGTTSAEFYLSAGTYQIRTKPYTWMASSGPMGGCVRFKVEVKDLGATNIEPNDSFAQAMVLSLNKKVRGAITLNDENDFYKIKVTKGFVKMTLTAGAYKKVYLYDKDWVKRGEYSYSPYNVSEELPGTTVISSPALEAGEYYVVVSGNRGSYQLTAAAFDGNLANAAVSLSENTFTYNGGAKRPKVVVKKNGEELKQDRDYTVSYRNNVNAGTAEVRITGKGRYTGSCKRNFTISRKKIEVNGFKLSNSSYTENGTSRRPNVNSYSNLVGGRDYTVAYQNNVYTGQATVVISGRGNYTGVVKKEFYHLSETGNTEQCQKHKRGSTFFTMEERYPCNSI